MLPIGFSNDVNPIQTIDHLSISRDFPVTDDLPEIANSAELIVVGAYAGFDSSWNMARKHDSILEEDARDYVEGRLYSFRIDETIKGTPAASTILVNHRFAERLSFIESNAIVDERGIIVVEATEHNEITFTLHDYLYIEPEIGAKYLLFLTKDMHFGNYYGSIEPFSMKIDNDFVYVQSNIFYSDGPAIQTVTVDNSTRTISVGQGSFLQLTDLISGRSLGSVIEEIILSINT